VKTVYRDTSLKITPVYRIFRNVLAGKPCGERRDHFAKKTKRTTDVIATVSAAFNSTIIAESASDNFLWDVGCSVGPLAIFFTLN
jgi:hypothetical protein